MCVRVYVPDRGQYPFGGVTLPDVALVQDGTTYSGKEMCSKINANNQDNGSYGITPVPPNFNLNKYIQLRQEGNGTDSTPPTWPARNPAIFRAYFNNVYQQCIVFTNGTDCNPSCTMDTDCASAPGAPFCIEGNVLLFTTLRGWAWAIHLTVTSKHTLTKDWETSSCFVRRCQQHLRRLMVKNLSSPTKNMI